jgi:hypothetical protein
MSSAEDIHAYKRGLTEMLLQISAVMDRFETQFEDLDVATGYYENATSSATAVATPQDEVDKLMGQVADEAGVELSQEMNTATPAKGIAAQPEEEREDKLGERLRALRASRLSSKSVGERAQSLHEIERTFMITCCEITGDWNWYLSLGRNMNKV